MPHQLDRFGRRADPDEPGLLDRTGEAGVLREEAVAGMHGLRATRARRVHQLLDREVALGCGLPAERDGLIGRPHVEGAAVRIRVHGDRPEPELAQSPEDPDRDLAAVRDEDVGEARHLAAYSPRG